ncbi:RNA-binding region-containing protein 3 [Anopheles nili]|uniref:RNA-binding region-containing protein 3 n=1 Tax=Anopheles nili TaxID=185578 RepID=UPI00237BE7CB|nr:RNA-binding region-containing protein 3 [Anopheles nili]
MSSISLRIFNFPPMFASVDIREFLHLFGLDTLGFIRRRNTTGAIVTVNSESEARLVIARLHQLLIKTHRLKVEYSDKKDTNEDIKSYESSENAETTKRKALDAIEDRLFPLEYEGFPPAHLSYRYPKSSPEILQNISRELASNHVFYYQTLHLMNKMNLKPPFECRTETSAVLDSASCQDTVPSYASVSEEESELESDTEQAEKKKLKTQYHRPAPTMKVLNYNPETLEPQSATKLLKKTKLEIQLSGEFLKAPHPPITEDDAVVSVTPIAAESSENVSLTVDDILRNRIPDEQRSTLSVFQNYNTGDPTSKLYIKNLAKQVTEQDLVEIFSIFFAKTLLKEIDVRLMKTGRMKGQAFVTFQAADDENPSMNNKLKSCIARALSVTNGYILKDKPMVVSYAKGI